jgi:type IV secretion system protein VirB6
VLRQQLINNNSFVSDLLNTVDLVISNFVQSGYKNLVANNQNVITMMMTLYIAWLGYRFMMHTLTLEVSALTRHLVLVIIVYALLIDWNLFYTFFYNVFTNEPGIITQTMLNSMRTPNIGGESTTSALNSVYEQGMNISKALFNMGNIHNIEIYFYGFLVAASTVIGCLIALAILIYAKMAMAVMLFLAPLFISFLLWDSTRKLFDNWLQALINYALIPIVTCGILMLTLSIANATLPGLQQNVTSGQPTFSGILPYLGVSLINALLFKQVMPTCAALSGGMALEAIGAAIPIAKQAFKATGIPAIGGRIISNRSPRRAETFQASAENKASRVQASRDEEIT